MPVNVKYYVHAVQQRHLAVVLAEFDDLEEARKYAQSFGYEEERNPDWMFKRKPYSYIERGDFINHVFYFIGTDKGMEP